MGKPGKSTLQALRGVHPQLSAVMLLAMALMEGDYDFGVTDGVRTLARQQYLVDTGASKTMRSRHLVQEDGYGHACDVIVYHKGRATWDFDDYKRVAEVVAYAAETLAVRVTWGGDWDRDGVAVPDDPDELFADGPHFQIEVRA